MSKTKHIKNDTSNSLSINFGILNFDDLNLFRISGFGFRVLLILIVLTTQFSFSQDVHAVAKVDSNHIMIGDWFKLHVEVEHPSDVTISMPSLPDSLNGFEIVKRDEPVTKQIEQRTLKIQEFIVTSFDSGLHIIPSIPIQYTRTGDTTKYLIETSPIPITVGTVAVDTSQDIKDVKPPLSVPITFMDVLPYLLGVVGVAGIIWLARYVIRKRKRGEPLIPQEPPRPANEVALEALRSLESEKLWQRGKVKDFHSQLTDIVRTYIERRYKIPAMESTSDEILYGFTDDMIVKDQKENLKEILVKADLVKFAKYQLVAEENEKSLTNSLQFVETTWKKETEPEIQPVAEEVKQ